MKSAGFWACIASFYPFMGPDIALAATPARPAYWASISVAPFLPCLWACHVDPLDLSPLPLGSYDPFTLLLPFVVSMSLLVVIPAMLAYWIITFFLGLPRPIYFTLLLIAPMGLLVVILAMLAH